MTTNRTMRISDEDWDALLRGAQSAGYKNRTAFVVALARGEKVKPQATRDDLERAVAVLEMFVRRDAER